MNEEARHFAGRVTEQSGGDVDSRIRLAFQLALSRGPSTEETKQVGKFFASSKSAEEALIGLCRVLLNSNEFVYVD